MTRQEKLAFISAIIYIAIMAVGMFVLTNVAGLSYQDPKMANTLVYFEIVMTIFSLFMYKKFFSGLSFNRIEKFPFKSITAALFSVLFIALIGNGVLRFATGNYVGKDMTLLFTIIFATLLVGISEELMFRGILLPALVTKRGKIRAVLISSIMFGLLHSVNIIGGLPAKEMLVQVILTSIIGILFSCIALEIKNIIPLMIYHWLWDGILISGGYLDSSGKELTFVLTLMELIFAIVFFIILIKKRKTAGKIY